MRSRELNRQLERLRSLIARAPAVSAGELELQAHWASYICVRVAGFLENAISEVYSEFAYSCSSPAAANYAASRLARIQNPKSRIFVETALAFRKEWGEALDQYLADGGRREAIDGIMNQRHQIAHGRDATITIARVVDYLAKSVDVIEFIERQCSGS